MARLTKISPYRAGAPRFGTKGHVQTWDNSVKVSYLSPEELEEYRSGRKGGSRMYTHEDYLQFQKDGLSNAEIAKKMNISQATLYNRLKVWKQQPLKNNETTSPETQIQSQKDSNGERDQEDKSGEFLALIAELKAELITKDKKISDLEKIDLDRETAYEALKHSHNKLIDQCSSLKTSVTEIDVEKMKIEIEDSHKQTRELQDKLQESEDNLQEVLTTNENLHKEMLIMNNSVARSTEMLNGASDEIEKLTNKYNSLLREVGPLRQLALMKLEQDASA